MDKLMQSVNLVNKHENVQRAITLAKRMLVNSIWKAANVEGLGTTLPNTEAILENLSVNTKRDEVLFVLNMRDAQLMANKILIKEGIGILAIPVEEVTTFKTILVNFYESNELVTLKEFLRTKCLQFI